MEEINDKEFKKTLNYMKCAPLLGLVVIIILYLTWVVPYKM